MLIVFSMALKKSAKTKEKPKSDQDFAENLILLLAFTKGEKKE